jgi:peroxiredoxin
MEASNRWQELEERFEALGPSLPEGEVREALSILHAMILEARRRPPDDGRSAGPDGRATANGRQTMSLERVANLYKTAPAMEGPAVSRGLPEGTPAPDFTLPDANGRLVSLSDFRGRPVVLVFYPLDWSPACSDQLSLYESELEEFARFNAQVLGISVDSLYSHGAWAAVRGLSFPLLADFNPRGEAARRYRVWREGDGFSERALFVVDGDGVIRYRHVSPQLHHVPDVYELFERLEKVAGAERPRTDQGG